MMNRTIIVLIISVLATPTLVAAGLLQNSIVFDTGYFGAPAGWNCPWGSPRMGDSLWIVGSVAEFNAPFTGMVPMDAGHEATFSFDGFVCTESGMWDDIPRAGGWYATFEGGTLKIYLDDTPDADFSNPATFRDGELLLEAQTFSLTLGTEPPHYAWFYFTGGSLFHVVSKDGVGYRAENPGTIAAAPPAMRDLGYVGESHSSVNVLLPVPTEETSWGKIKMLYE
jgi:hypothetical protein